MQTYSYTLETTPQASGRTNITKTVDLTGTTKVTFALSGLSAYDASIADAAASKNYRINKIIVDFDDPDTTEDNLVLNRSLSATTLETLSTITFDHVVETDFTQDIKREVFFTIQRDDSEVDIITVTFNMTRAKLDTYENINLINTDYFNDEAGNDERLLVTFIQQNPEVLGLNLVDLSRSYTTEFDPASGLSQALSSNNLNVGFTTEYVHVQAADSNTLDHINVKLDPATGMIKTNSNVTLKWRTRAQDPDNYGQVTLPSNPEVFYIPITANSGFIHLSGYLNWNCGDLLKDVDLSTQTVTIPLIDITGTRTNLTDYFFTNVNTGVGTSMASVVKGGYFMVDLYDTSSCDTITTTTSTITAFVNY